jgi:hypothetical protein
MTFDKLPTAFKLATLALVLLAGPVVLFSFLLIGPYGGIFAVILLMIAAIVLYMFGVRMGWRK